MVSEEISCSGIEQRQEAYFIPFSFMDHIGLHSHIENVRRSNGMSKKGVANRITGEAERGGVKMIMGRRRREICQKDQGISFFLDAIVM